MAGSYPDVPGPKIQYHLNGSVGLRYGSSDEFLGEMDLARVNGYSGDVLGARKSGIIFPYPFDLVGMLLIINNTGSLGLSVSSNTTNILDGDWSTIDGAFTGNNNIRRRDFSEINEPNIIGVRINPISSKSIYSWYIYGSPSSTAPRQQLAFWHPTNDEPAPGPMFDTGDVLTTTDTSVPFRVKNLSDTYTANDIELSVDLDSNPGALVFDDGANSPATPLDIGSLAPEAISPVINAVRTAGPIGLGWFDFSANADSWT